MRTAPIADRFVHEDDADRVLLELDPTDWKPAMCRDLKIVQRLARELATIDQTPLQVLQAACFDYGSAHPLADRRKKLEGAEAFARARAAMEAYKAKREAAPKVTAADLLAVPPTA